MYTKVYPIGIPLSFGIMLYSKVSILIKPREERTEEENREVAHLDFLAGAYREKYWCVPLCDFLLELPSNESFKFYTNLRPKPLDPVRKAL